MRSPDAPKITMASGGGALDSTGGSERLVRDAARLDGAVPVRSCRGGASRRLGAARRVNGVAAELVAQRGHQPLANEFVLAEAKRAKSAAVITGAGTSRSMASSTVQRPSPESTTSP